MRSSIACIRCRRSKVKCVNNGVGTTCRSCENSGRECSYPSPVAAGSRRRDSLSGRADGHGHGHGHGDAERRQRPRKSASSTIANPGSSIRDSPRPLLDALDARILTPAVWQELFDIFQIHYSADLPFLHPPTFLKPLRQAAFQQTSTDSDSAGPPTAVRPPASTEFLLAFLALTARFHPKLVAHHSPPTSTRASNPLIASEYYASATSERMASLWTENCGQDIERTQATLMLGLHEWGMCRGAKAWVAVGTAIRAAQAMGLQYELDLDDEPMSRSLALSVEAERMGVDSNRKNTTSDKLGEGAFIQQEIRRRTFWSCYIMDRYLSSGKYRPQMLHARELRIQLPASERSFLFAEKVRTLMLGEEDGIGTGTGRAEVQNQRQQSVMLSTANGTPEPNVPSPKSLAMLDNDEDKGRLETGPDEGLVSRYVKVLEIYGKVIKWSCSGGRRTEEFPPWDPRCEFYKLRRQCEQFKASLPRQNTLTPQNTQAHISLKTSTPYTLVHTVYLLCQIMLHREYVPFIPIRCSKPEGPLDAPMFPPDKYAVPPGFWEENARNCFRSAREIMDLVRTCQEWSALVETPIVGFAIYTVAFNGVYCINFPWMDPDGYMCTASSSPYASVQANNTRPGESKGFDAARKALEMIGSMRPKLHMADGWFKTINRMHKYFRRLKSDYRKSAQTMESSSESDSPISTRHLSLREGGSGGGLDEFRLLERTLQEFGNLEDEDVDMADLQQNDSRALDGIYDDSSAGSEVKSEGPGERAAVPDASHSEAGAWSAINAGPGPAPPSRQSSIATSTPVSQFRSYESYPHQHHAPTPPQTQASYSSQAQSYNHQVNNFRPSFSHSSVSAPSSLTSPISHSAAGTTPSHSRLSPPSDRRHQHASHKQNHYQSWATPSNPHYAMHPPPPTQYANASSQQQQQQQQQQHQSHAPHHPSHSSPHHHLGSMQPTPSQSAYSSPIHTGHQLQQPQHHPPMVDPQQQAWAPASKEAWLNSIDTRLGGDDIAAFVDGGEMHEWASMAATQGFGGGWLSTVWGGGNGS